MVWSASPAEAGAFGRTGMVWAGEADGVVVWVGCVGGADTWMTLPPRSLHPGARRARTAHTVTIARRVTFRPPKLGWTRQSGRPSSLASLSPCGLISLLIGFTPQS